LSLAGNRKRGALPKAFRPPPAAAPNRKRDRAAGPPSSDGDDPGPRSPAGRRIVRAAGRLVVAAVVIALFVWGGIAAYRQATSAEYFAVTDIRVIGNSRLGEAEVVKAAAIERGVNIFRVDVEVLAVRLKQHPWILDATAVRRLPRGLEITIVERKLEALVLFDVPYLVDDAGAVFKRWTPGDPTPAPIISGLSREQLAADEESAQATINDAIALARRYRAQGLDRVAPLAEVHAEIDGGFSLTAGAEPFYVHFGKGPYREKLARLAELLRRLRADGEKPAVVYFDNEIRPDRVTVKVVRRPAPETPSGVEITRAR